MAGPGAPGRGRLPVVIDEQTWREEVGRLREGSPARLAAERERRRLERDGVEPQALRRCRGDGPGGTRLPGMLKAYVPIADAPASQRPFGFVFRAAKSGSQPTLSLEAYGERHPPRGTRSVYERAHKRLHGRYPDQATDTEPSARAARATRGPAWASLRPAAGRDGERTAGR